LIVLFFPPMKLLKFITNKLTKRNFFVSKKIFIKEVSRVDFDSEIVLSKIPVVLERTFKLTKKKFMQNGVTSIYYFKKSDYTVIINNQ
jgi:hypothetical protein